MLIFLQELCLQLFLWMLKLIDGIMEIFSSISGVTNVRYNGKQVNMLELLVGDSTISAIFWCIFILAIGLACIFTIVGLVKNMVANNRNISSIVGKFFLSILGTMAMLSVVFIGILIANTLLQLLAKIFQVGNTTKLSNALFNACVGNWLNGYNINNVNITSLSVADIFGGYKAALFGVWPTTWKCNGMVNPNTFLYLPSMIASIALCVALIMSILNLAKRIYEIIYMYFCMPVAMSTLPLDDGARFKNWREQFVTKIILAYGAVLAVNIFVLILPLIQRMSLPGIGSFGNSIFLIFMIVGGAMLIPSGQTLFARLFGSADDMHASGGWLRSAYYGGRVVSAMTIGLAAKGLKGVFYTIKHKKSKGNDNGDSDSSGDDGDKYTEDSVETPQEEEESEDNT